MSWIDTDFRVLPFMSQNWKDMLETKNNEVFESLAENPVVWDEDKTVFQKAMVIDANTWSPSQLFPDRPRFLNRDIPYDKQYRISPNKEWGYINRLMKRGTALDLYQGNKRGKVGFTDDVIIPCLVNTKNWTPYMSMAPAEILSQRPGIRKATGKVLIGGLGIGWFLRKVAQKKSVREIIIIEICEDLLDWYGYNLCEQISNETNTPIKVICDDVLNHMGKHGDDTRYLIDIWESFPTEFWELSREWQGIIPKIKHFWGWGVFELPKYDIANARKIRTMKHSIS